MPRTGLGSRCEKPNRQGGILCCESYPDKMHTDSKIAQHRRWYVRLVVVVSLAAEGSVGCDTWAWHTRHCRRPFCCVIIVCVLCLINYSSLSPLPSRRLQPVCSRSSERGHASHNCSSRWPLLRHLPRLGFCMSSNSLARGPRP